MSEYVNKICWRCNNGFICDPHFVDYEFIDYFIREAPDWPMGNLKVSMPICVGCQEEFRDFLKRRGRGGYETAWPIVKNKPIEDFRMPASNGQTKTGSAIEATVNILFGFGVATVCNMVVLPWFGFKCTLRDSLGIGAIFTVVSFVRSYILRRVFNWITIKWRL